jgi:hypothetical protein
VLPVMSGGFRTASSLARIDSQAPVFQIWRKSCARPPLIIRGYEFLVMNEVPVILLDRRSLTCKMENIYSSL